MRTALQGARVLIDGELRSGQAVILRDRIIDAVLPADDLPGDVVACNLDGGILAPGFIDTQVNGGGGVLFNDNPCVETIAVIADAHRRFGTTGFLPTLISGDAGKIARAMRAVEDAIEAGVPGVLGIHLEGPFVSPRKAGIHSADSIIAPDDDILTVLAMRRRGVTMVTVAPEVFGAGQIERLSDAGVIVSAGHTDATYEQTVEGLAAGVRGFTHLFNAMSPMASRAPGAVGAALDSASCWCGLIVDGVHVHPAVLRIALRSRPIDRFMLVTDAMPPVGTRDAEFALQGRRIKVEKGRCSDENGILAGSVLNMAGAVRNCIDQLGLEPAIALTMAAAYPSEFLRMESIRGRIGTGQAADLVWLSDALQVRSTWIAGVAANHAEPATSETSDR